MKQPKTMPNPNRKIISDYKRATKILLTLAANPTLDPDARHSLTWTVNFLDIAWAGSVPMSLNLPADKIVLDRHKAYKI